MININNYIVTELFRHMLRSTSIFLHSYYCSILEESCVSYFWNSVVKKLVLLIGIETYTLKVIVIVRRASMFLIIEKVVLGMAMLRFLSGGIEITAADLNDTF